MKLRIQFEREANYYHKKLTLLLMRYFKPRKFTLLNSGDTWTSKGPEVYMEGAEPVNPFDVMKEINEAMAKEVKDWSHSFEISYIEMETPKEKEKIDTWVLIDKIKPGTLI